MGRWPDLTHRADDPERMDDPHSSEEQLRKTLLQFQRINRFLTPSRSLLRRYVLKSMRTDPERAWTLLDVGAGGGDTARWLIDQCTHSKIRVRVTCVDHDPRVIAFAREQCQDYPAVEVIQEDATNLPGWNRQWDFVFSNHVLHHLATDRLPAALEVIDQVCARRFVLSDIHRSMANYVGYSLLASVWLRDSFAYYDGRLSIRKGFTAGELRGLVERAAMTAHTTVRASIPGHLAIIGEK